MKKFYIIIVIFVLLFGCTQKSSEIIYKGTGVYSPAFSDTYVESPDGKIARSLRSVNDSDKAQEVNIINQEVKEEVKDEAIQEGYYRVKEGDSLWSISAEHGMSLAEIISINNLKRPYNVRVGVILKIQDNFKDSNNFNSIYTVKSGDSLSMIAKNHNMSSSKLAELNELEKPYKIFVGQKLRISNTTADTDKIKKPAEIKTTTYTVKSGDNLSTIANKNNMGTTQLAELNNLQRPYKIFVGQKLKVNSSGSNTIIEKNEVAKPAEIKTTTYTVKSGDNLSTIANKNNMETTQLAELNNLQRPYKLFVGQKLKINSSGSNTIVATSTPKPSTPKPITPKVSTTTTSNSNEFIWPIKGEILSSFGKKTNGLANDGINISGEKGSTFKVVNDGIVSYVGNEIRSYGTIVLIKHSNNWISVYGHCDTVSVAKGDKVVKGQIIGTIGQSGNVKSPQLYFSLRKGREAVDPTKHLK